MKKTSTLLLAFLAALELNAQTTSFTYQGRLNDGANPANGSYDLSFALFDAASGGNPVGGVLTNAATGVSNGLFNVTLDFGSGVFTGADRWLEIGVVTNGGGAFSTLSPRQQVTATPYAMQAASAGTAATAGSVNAANILGSLALAQLPGAVVTNGASGVSLSGGFAGNGGGLSNLSFSQIAGTVPLAQLPKAVVINDQSGVTLSGAFSGSGAGLRGVDLRTVNSAGAIVWTTVYSFQHASSPGVGNFPVSVVAADVNGDGKVDLISANQGASTLSVLTNDGTGGFVLASSPAVGNGPYSVVAADVNGDGKVDLISANFNANTLTVLTNDGSGGFVFSSSPGLGRNPYSVVAADINGDGKVDLICASLNTNKLTVLTNNGSGGFVVASLPVVGNNPISVVAADVNGDGNVDLICANLTDSTLSVLTNNGSGGFALASTPAVGNGPYSVVASDVNGDGKVDLISANYADSTLTVLTNNGSGGFVLASTLAVGNQPESVVAADVNGDGKVDLISANVGNHNLTVLINNGSGGFMVVASPDVSNYDYSVVAADVNGDGLLDLITVSATANTLFVLFNKTTFTASFTGNGGSLSNLSAASLNGALPTDTTLKFTGDRTNGFQNPVVLLENTDTGSNAAPALRVVNDGGQTPEGALSVSANVSPTAPSSIIARFGNSDSWAVTITNDGTIYSAGGFAGNGARLTNLNASQLTGVVPLARLPAAVVTNGAAGLNLSGTFSGNAADLTNVPAANLTGSVPAAVLTSIPAANLTGSVPAASLTSVPAANLTGTVADARLTSNVALLNGTNAFSGSNIFSGVATLTNLNNTLTGTHSGNGAALTSLNAGSLASGTLADARLSANVALLNTNQTFAGSNTFSGVAALINVNNSLTGTHSGNGAALTSLNAGNVSSGTLSDARLSGNVALLNTNQTFSGSNTFSGVNSLTNVNNTLVGTHSGNGSGLTGLNASSLTTGTVPLPLLPSGLVTNGESALTLAGAFTGNGAGLTNLYPTNLNGALPLNTGLKFTGDRTNGFANSLVILQNTNTSSSAAPALRLQNDGGATPNGALSVSANVAANAANSLIAQFGNASSFVVVITNDGTIYSKGVALTSDRNSKEGFRAVDGKLILEKVASLPMTEWDYKDTPGIRHLGPMAQDFHAAFGLNGGDDHHISVVDQGGVALAAIQGLNQKLEQKETEITDLKASISELKALFDKLAAEKNGGAR